MVTVVVIEFSVMRCQPLRRALCVFLEVFHSSALIIQT
ncbi:acetyltransferase [Vibrio cholerae]|nr:acetyltransferase [Vibrio cholerae]MCO7014013.1 acetyltransferase [Vibrio paracholerae]MCO7025179.1 acetyltransferase [Vibrio paracholerae]MCO7034500.1 acetyltransferase [Vibrio paracholerae]MCO7047984.1 acetyltransferase [Vibrio paracholerae]MDA5312390.1 acetyltransferase [Vibrio cholerae]